MGGWQQSVYKRAVRIAKGVHRSKEKGKNGLQDLCGHVLSKHVGAKQAGNADSRIQKTDTTK